MTIKAAKPFRIKEAGGQKAYQAGDVLSGLTAEWAVRNGFAQKAAPEPKNKAKRPPHNKAPAKK